MANAEHVEILRQGPQLWNAYVANKPAEFTANLNGAVLNEAKLYGANLNGAKLYRADLRRAELTTAELTTADLNKADLTGADLYEANLTAANLTAANLAGSNLNRSNLYEANLTAANLTAAKLVMVDLRGSNLSRANLTGADLYGADLNEAYLTRVVYDNETVWPDNFDPEKAGARLEDIDDSGPLDSDGVSPVEESKPLTGATEVPAVEVRSVRELVEIVPNPEPSQQDIEAAQRETEKLVGQAQHFVHEGTWKDRPDLEHDVEFLIRALKEELSSVVDRTPSIGVVQTYGSRLSQYLLGIETSELDKAGDEQAAIEARQFSDEILTGLEDATDINAALESADWIAEHLKLKPQQDNEPAAELENSYATVTDAVAWTQQASTLLSTGADAAQVTGLLGGSVGFVLGAAFNVDPGTAAGVGAMIGGVGGLISTVVGFILTMLKANFKTKD